MKALFLFSFLFLAYSSVHAQDIEVYDAYKVFEANLIKDSSKVYVVNYWATWCAPCIKELPFFENLHKDYKDKGIEVVLVSIDFKNQYKSKLVPFVADHNLEARVIHMADTNANKWIEQIDPSWSGAIPVSLFIIGKDRLFMERAFDSYEELKLELDKFLDTIQ